MPKKPKYTDHPASPVQICPGRNCARPPTVKLHSPENFRGTSSSHLPRQSAAQKRAHGCIEKNKKFTGYVCLEKNPAGECILKAQDARCSHGSAPCSERAQCPVQLVWVNGKPNLRFCRTLKKPGWLIPVADPEKAQTLASQACDKWKISKKWPRDFWKKHAPNIVVDAKQAYPKSRGLGKLDHTKKM